MHVPVSCLQVVACCFVGCGISGVGPDGFAEYKKPFAKVHRSISAD